MEMPHPKDPAKEIIPVEYTETERKYRQYLLQRLCLARDEREKNHIEFDEMSYTNWYNRNRKADLSFLPKKKNREDDRITTGITREKDTTMLAFLLNFNLEPNVMVFDEEDTLLAGLGERMELCLKKSRQLEDYDLVRPLIYREFISQGDVFVEEIWEESYTIRRIITNEWTPNKPISEYNATNVPSLYCRKAVSRLVEGTKVYLGNIKTENVKDQPFLYTYEVIPRDEAKTIYENWSRWENVPMTVENTTLPAGVDIGDVDWSVNRVEANTVGVLKYQDKIRNEYMVMLNGVMMLPVGYPLTMINPSGEFSISQGKYESIPNFAYSKSQPSKSKVEQGLLDEMYKLMLYQWKQTARPTMANMSGKTVTNSIFMPGKVVNNLKPGEVVPLFGGTQGITSAQFSFFELVKQSIDDKTLNRSFAGQESSGDPTATQIIEERNQNMMKLGLAMDGILGLERQLAWNRLYTIIHHWTSDEAQTLKENMAFSYQKLHHDDTFEDGKEGMRVIEFAKDLGEYEDEDMQNEMIQSHFDKEEEMSKEYDKPVRITYINPQMLKEFKGMWHIMMVATDKNSDEVDRMLFVQNIQEAQTIFGAESLNYSYLKQRYANKLGEDPMKMFVDVDPMQLKSQLIEGQKPQSMGGGAPVPNSKATMSNPRRGLSMKTMLKQ